MTSPRPIDFVEANPGQGWMLLPLPTLIVDVNGRVAAMNDAAEIWLNLSRTSTLGERLEGDKLSNRLRIRPSLRPLGDRVAHGEEALYQPAVKFEIGDRAGGYQTRTAAVHAGTAGGSDGAISILIVPEDDDGVQFQRRTLRTAARSAIGMSEMLAHEIKNPLAGIRGAAQLIAMNASPEDREMAEMIVSESRRIVTLLDQVERFGDTSPPGLVSVNVHDVLEQVRRSATVGFAKDFTIQTDYDPSLPHALADPDQLIQVCLNLTKNAAEAMAHQPGTIRLRSFYDHRLRMLPDDDHPKGRALPLQIEIEDDGPGIPTNIARQIFEPFVSGRENGTGLGLALVSKIVTDHGAFIRAESRPGKTVFRISLPMA